MACFKFLEIVLNTVKWYKIANVTLFLFFFKSLKQTTQLLKLKGGKYFLFIHLRIYTEMDLLPIPTLEKDKITKQQNCRLLPEVLYKAAESNWIPWNHENTIKVLYHELKST